MIVKDANKLRNEAKELIRQEKAAWQQEQLEAQKQRDAITIAPDAGRDVTKLEQQIGRPMRGGDIQKRLRTLNPLLRFEVANADSSITGIYLGPTFVCGMETNISPEFSVRHSPTGKVMRGETRGWRTVLAMLIRRGIITQKGAEDAFHILFSSTESQNWSKYVVQ